MSWEIVVGIITLVTALGTVGTWVFKLSKILSTLDATMKQLNITLEELKKSTSGRFEKLEAKIEAHEVRIVRLEDKHA